MATDTDKKQYLYVPFEKKAEAKAAGAFWDAGKRRWFVGPQGDMSVLEQWLTPQVLYVPYGEREAAKKAGALWDKKNKYWYVGSKGDLSALSKWIIPPQEKNPHEEFAEWLIARGARLPAGHPIMDGKKHNVPVGDSRANKVAMTYCGFLDGIPAGYMKNFKTGRFEKWRQSGQSMLSKAELKALQKESEAKRKQREIERKKAQQEVANKIDRQLTSGWLKQITPAEPTPYIIKKGIKVFKGIYTTKDNNLTCVPAHDIDGNVRTMQYIDETGNKRFPKDAQNSGSFHVIGGLERLAKARYIPIAEGYATAATMAAILKTPVVVAFNSGGLQPVGKALAKRFPNKKQLYLADDDRHLLHKEPYVNVGIASAIEAAQATNGFVVIPRFAANEMELPGYTDFNDMDVSSSVGRDGIKRIMVEFFKEVREHPEQLQGGENCKQFLKTTQPLPELADKREPHQQDTRNAPVM